MAKYYERNLTIDSVAAAYLIGDLSTACIPETCADLLEAGYYSDSLAAVTLSPPNDAEEIETYFKLAMKELKVKIKTRKQAAIFVACDYAQRTLDGDLTPWEGGKELLKLAQYMDDKVKALEPVTDAFLDWVYREGEDADHPSDDFDDLAEQRVLDECRKLLDSSKKS